MTTRNADEVRDTVRGHYTEVARTNGACGCGPGCCSPGQASGSTALGYSATELGALPEGADMGLGCGTPLTFAALRPGEVVVDLGSGGGIDCLLAAKQVGPRGRIIGVDISDIVASDVIPEDVRNDSAALAGRIAGAPTLGELKDALEAAGFVDINIEVNLQSRSFIKDWAPGSGAESYIAAASITAMRARGDSCCGTSSTSG